MSEESPEPKLVQHTCVSCGTPKNLVKDRDNEEVFYCQTCYNRNREQEFLIKALGMQNGNGKNGKKGK